MQDSSTFATRRARRLPTCPSKSVHERVGWNYERGFAQDFGVQAHTSRACPSFPHEFPVGIRAKPVLKKTCVALMHGAEANQIRGKDSLLFFFDHAPVARISHTCNEDIAFMQAVSIKVFSCDFTVQH